MGSILEDVGEISTGLVKYLVMSPLPQETTRDVVYLSLVSHVGGSPIASTILTKFQPRESPHVGSSCSLSIKGSSLLLRRSFFAGARSI